MKIYFMKQSALDYMKLNIGKLYSKYYTFDTPDWIIDELKYDPFVEMCEIPDFELADLNQKPGEIDFENCKILYSNLKFLSDSQAADERVWAGLTNKTFYQYMRKRWEYGSRHLKKTSDDSLVVMARYYYKNSGRSGMFRNTLARCWWVGRLTYSEKINNHWELLDAIGSEDFLSKVSDVFYSNTFASNPEIVAGFCKGLKFFRDRGIYVSNRDHIRPTAQYLNAIGGGVLLDMFSSDEVCKMVVERIGFLNKGVDIGFGSDENLSEDDLEENENDDKADEVNVDFEEFMDSLEPATEIDLDEVLGELEEVEYGCTVFLRVEPEGDFFISKIPLLGEHIFPLQERLIGKKIGYRTVLRTKTYEIIDIRRR